MIVDAFSFIPYQLISPTKKMKSFLKKVKGFANKCEEKGYKECVLKYFDKSVTM